MAIIDGLSYTFYPRLIMFIKLLAFKFGAESVECGEQGRGVCTLRTFPILSPAVSGLMRDAVYSFLSV